MTTKQFSEWFHDDFVPHVQDQLKSLGEEQNAVIVLDNCSAHPAPKYLVSDDGAVIVEFLPPYV